MTTFRSSAYDALVAVLISQRKAQKLSQTDVAKALPAWLGFDYTTVNKIEHKRRNVSFVEVQEIARVLGTSVATIDLQAEAVAVALSHPVRRATARRKR